MSPESASTVAPAHDFVFWLTTILALFFFVVVVGAVAILTYRYRAGNRVDRSNAPHEHLPLELTWTTIPLVLALIVFFLGTKVFMMQRTAPKDAIPIFVIGKQWMWHFQHGNGVRENNALHVPVGRPVKLIMISQDVIHGLYLPEFRVQYMVVPGRYTQEWFTATKPGVYHLFCSLYCGTQHSEMGGAVYAMPEQDYVKWLQNGGNDVSAQTAEERGAKLFSEMRCGSCHGPNKNVHGPSLYGIAGTTVKLANGQSKSVDLPFMREAILHPWDNLLQGWDRTMPQYSDSISEEQLLDLIAYVGSLSDKGQSTSTNVTLPPQVTLLDTRNGAVGAIGARETQSEEGRNGNPGAIGARN